MSRPEIAQAIRDAALSKKQPFFGAAVEWGILGSAFMWPSELVKCFNGKGRLNGWLRTTEGRTYMLLVSEALS